LSDPKLPARATPAPLPPKHGGRIGPNFAHAYTNFQPPIATLMLLLQGYISANANGPTCRNSVHHAFVIGRRSRICRLIRSREIAHLECDEQFTRLSARACLKIFHRAKRGIVGRLG
jgi:hypothetical protein